MRIFSYEELDELGEGLIRQYLGKEAERTCCVDIEGFVTDFLKLPLLYRSFAEEDSDKIGLFGKWQIQWACPSPHSSFGCGSWAVCVTARWRSTSRRKWGWDRTVAQDEKSKRSP